MFDRMTEAGGCGSRRILWENVAYLIAQKPWFGWGWGELDYAHYATLYPGARFCDILDNAHNLPLHLAVELGLPVAVAACIGAVWCVVHLAPWRESDQARQMAWAVLAVIGLHSMVEYPLWYGPFQLAAGLAVGLLAVRRGAPLAAHRFAFPTAVAVLFSCELYAAWDYHRVSQIYLPPGQRAMAYRDDTLAEIGHSWLFRNQAEFAELSITPLTRANAVHVNALALRQLHYSPEPKVIEKLIESASLLGQTDLALWHLARYRAAFPQEFAAWSGRQGAASRPP